jgi:predicted trehalose synthase
MSRRDAVLCSRPILFFALLGAWPAAQACEVGEQKVQQVMSARVATYDENGDFKEEIGKERIPVNAPLVACRDSPALVKIRTTDGAEVWVDRLDVKIAGAPVKQRQCRQTVISRESDTRAPAVSGVDPCSG